MQCRINVNGREHEVDPPRSTTLLSVLRDDLGLTATRYGCGRGQCGACYVLADDRAVASCMMKVEEVEGQRIVTLEGLSQEGLHPVQEAFIAEDALQCGYCTTGMIMAAVALLKEVVHPNEEDIRRALGGNLCRCGVHNRIISAVLRASS